MEHDAETLRRRIALYRNQLRAGVIGSLAIKYLRQIAEDDEALSQLRDAQSEPTWDSLAAVPCG